jgi:hypothetical protein
MTQMNLGNARWTLGERHGARAGGSGSLSRGVGGKNSRAGVARLYATQMALGVAFKALGEQQSGTTRPEEAVAA